MSPTEQPTSKSSSSVNIRQVWQENLLDEFDHIGKLITRFSYISMDTEFPGCVIRPMNPNSAPNHHHKLHPFHQYQLIKHNVDILNLIQVGLTLTDSDGNLPKLDGENSIIWQFNFKDFDISRDMCAPDSIHMLKKQGIDFERNRSEGINSAHFAALMMHYKLVCNNDITWVTFHSAYDFGYLVKILTRRRLPNFLPEFLCVVNELFGHNVYDMKHLMRFCPGLYGGLEHVARALQIIREVGLSHQAASDSLLTWRTFHKMRLTCFDCQNKDLKTHAGVLYGLEIYCV